MIRIIQVSDGAFFVPSFSEQTILTFQPGITTQLGTTAPDYMDPVHTEVEESSPDTVDDITKPKGSEQE